MFVVVSCLWVRTYVGRGRPAGPNPLRGKDLGRQHTQTKTSNPSWISSWRPAWCSEVAQYGGLSALPWSSPTGGVLGCWCWEWLERGERFWLQLSALCKFLKSVNRKRVVEKSWFLDVLSSPAAGEFSPLWAATLLVVHWIISGWRMSARASLFRHILILPRHGLIVNPLALNLSANVVPTTIHVVFLGFLPFALGDPL